MKSKLPILLTGLSVLGLVGTTFMSIKNTREATLYFEDNKERLEDADKKETIKELGKFYIPTILMFTATSVFMIGSAVTNKKNQTAIFGSYAVLNETFANYRNAAKTVYGKDADSKILEESEKIFVSADGHKIYTPELDRQEDKMLFFDEFSRRYFNSSLGMVLNAQYHINRNFILKGSVPINEFYEFLGIGEVPGGNGNDIGWGWDLLESNIMWIDFENQFVLTDDGLECCIIRYIWEPHVL